jgi:hypothetical protein
MNTYKIGDKVFVYGQGGVCTYVVSHADEYLMNGVQRLWHSGYNSTLPDNILNVQTMQLLAGGETHYLIPGNYSKTRAGAIKKEIARVEVYISNNEYLSIRLRDNLEKELQDITKRDAVYEDIIKSLKKELSKEEANGTIVKELEQTCND